VACKEYPAKCNMWLSGGLHSKEVERQGSLQKLDELQGGNMLGAGSASKVQ